MGSPTSSKATSASQNPLVYARPLRRNDVTLWSSHAAHHHVDGGVELVVVDEFPASLSACDAVEAQARRLVGIRHPNLATVRAVIHRDDARLIVTDFIE